MKAARLHGRKISVTMGHEFSGTISTIGDGITVISSEPGAARKEKVLSTGVSHQVIDSMGEDVTARVMGLTDGVGANVAFECTSIKAALDQLTDEGFDPLIRQKESAVKIIARPEVTDVP